MQIMHGEGLKAGKLPAGLSNALMLVSSVTDGSAMTDCYLIHTSLLMLQALNCLLPRFVCHTSVKYVQIMTATDSKP